MKCAPFEYVRPTSVDDVLAALAEADGEGKILAGGQSLVPVMALRMARPAVLVDVNKVEGLSDLECDDGSVHVGALVRHRTLAEQTAHPLLAEAARHIGHTAIRTRGTAGGSIAHADPAAELPVVAVATGATVTVAGADGDRWVAAEDLFAGPLMTTLDPDEMVTGIDFPVPTRWGFAEFARRHGDFALVTVVVAEVDGDLRIVVGGVGPVPIRARSTGAETLGDELTPTGDLHGSADFRRGLAIEMARRALASAGIQG
ncbi:xanthine dehydrogenase family protein subunit M [Pseudonocardia sp. N23]|uniref:FAD binding domain-containing protein n=1 Tax=Pseudonocardia sp. N23 TaxID=1987376 RepID=UPI000BFB343C|nr:FAD binding domain-containing protein [Pseudonocardia sp. N23]GAY08850.1 carbon monoxide dehydrogenase medium chain [Pseudonocardia sp. N23]